jgi:DNA polymerase-3 subunit delta'
VRKIKDFTNLTPSETSSRVVIIDSADYMNQNAANANLKVLEEPNKNTFLILISEYFTSL